jgi:TetR/AcrR family transcriptional regulator
MGRGETVAYDDHDFNEPSVRHDFYMADGITKVWCGISRARFHQSYGLTAVEKSRPLTRIQTKRRRKILEAALEIFSTHGLRGATIDQIAEAAGMSKPNLLYYFRSKEEIHSTLIKRLLDDWLQPLRDLDADGDPMAELQSYIRRKMEMSRDFPREGRLFTNEILQGAPHTLEMLQDVLKPLVDEKVKVIEGWMKDGRIARTDPYHLIFSLWATTQHYADFDVQVRAVLGPDRSGERLFEDGAQFLEQLYLNGLSPEASRN